jgi:cardiolipin synthase
VQVQQTQVQTDRVLTIPNVLSGLRLVGVPVFLWLVLVPQADVAAFCLLAVSGITDWADGAIARATGQISRLGQILDPLADRLYIAATLLGLALRGIIPWWLLALLVARDLLLLAFLPALRRRGLPALPVHYLGKAATFCLLWGFPLLLLGAGEGTLATVARVLGWAFAIWGTGLYWYAGMLYAEQALRVIRTRPVQA